MSMRQCSDYAKEGMDCMRRGLPPVSWCENCCYNIEVESNRAIQMVEQVERNPERFDASARASAELMRWLIWDRLRRVSAVSEKLRMAIDREQDRFYGRDPDGIR